MKKMKMKYLFLGLLMSGSMINLTKANPLTLSRKTNVDSSEIVKTKPAAGLEEVYIDADYQLVGVAISPKGRMFVSYPYWLDKHSYSVVEIGADKKPHPFPDAAWNSFKKGEDGSQKFVSVQAVYADDKNNLW